MDQTPTHAGCIVYREEDGRKSYLVVSSSLGDHWVLPKGHIDENETPEEAALRELEEEAGVVGEIIRPVSILGRYESSGEEVIIQYYLVKSVGTSTPAEKREVRWVDQETALELLSFEDSRNIFRIAIDAIGKLS